MRASASRTRTGVYRAGAFFGADVFAFALASMLAFVLDVSVRQTPLQRAYEQATWFGPEWHGWGTLMVLACLLAYFATLRHYTARVPFWSELGSVIGGIGVALACDGFIQLAVYQAPFHVEGGMRWALFAPLLLANRQLAKWMLDAAGLWTIRTVIVGDPTAADGVRRALLSEPGLGYMIAGTLAPETINTRDLTTRWRDVLHHHAAELVVVAVGYGDGEAQRRTITSLSRARIPFALVPTFDGLPVTGFTSHYFFSHDVMMLSCGNNLARPISRLVKTAFDQVAAAILLVFLSPVFLAIASLVRRDGGPILFGHTRLGAHRTRFRCMKFRTMVTDADRVLRELLENDPAARAEWAETQKLRDDPRVTPIGRFLRRTSLDELPQLFNVLRGEMSLVGPRPIVDAEVPRYADDIEYYFETKPGMTGLWQVSGRSDTSYDYRVRLDVWYVRNWTLWHDIAILLKTIPAVLLKRGAA